VTGYTPPGVASKNESPARVAVSVTSAGAEQGHGRPDETGDTAGFVAGPSSPPEKSRVAGGPCGRTRSTWA